MKSKKMDDLEANRVCVGGYGYTFENGIWHLAPAKVEAFRSISDRMKGIDQLVQNVNRSR